jgi:hypothetical protein
MKFIYRHIDICFHTFYIHVEYIDRKSFVILLLFFCLSFGLTYDGHYITDYGQQKQFFIIRRKINKKQIPYSTKLGVFYFLVYFIYQKI